MSRNPDDVYKEMQGSLLKKMLFLIILFLIVLYYWVYYQDGMSVISNFIEN